MIEVEKEPSGLDRLQLLPRPLAEIACEELKRALRRVFIANMLQHEVSKAELAWGKVLHRLR